MKTGFLVLLIVAFVYLYLRSHPPQAHGPHGDPGAATVKEGTIR